MKVNITGFMRNMLRPRCSEMVAEFLGHLKELRNDPSRHAEFFDLYVFGDDTQWRASKREVSPANGEQQANHDISPGKCPSPAAQRAWDEAGDVSYKE